MKTNRIDGAFNRQPHLEREESVGGPEGIREETVREEELPPRLGWFSSLIGHDRIAREFIRMDGSADPVRQKPSTNSAQATVSGTPRGNKESAARAASFRAIVYDDAKWDFFLQSVSLKAPHSEPAKRMRRELIDGFESGDWSEVKNDPLFQELTEKASTESNPAEGLSGIGKRIDLWLENSDFFKQLFTAVQDGDLFNRPHLLTDNLLIDFVLSLPEDAE